MPAQLDRSDIRDYPEGAPPLPREDLRQRADSLAANHPSSPRYLDERGAGHETTGHETTGHETTGHETTRHAPLAERMLREVRLQPDSRDLPPARDIIRNVDRAQVDPRKLADYSMNPGHPQNDGKARAWAAVGYDVTSSAQRREAAGQLGQLIGRHLLPEGRVANVREIPGGADYRVINGFIGPNGRHGTLVTCWRVPQGERAEPRLLTTWLAVHPEVRR